MSDQLAIQTAETQSVHVEQMPETRVVIAPAPAPLLPEDRFLNREMSWLAFNRRVLEEANNPNNPLLERVRFLSIAGSNMEEFFIVRAASVRTRVREDILQAARAAYAAQQECLRTLLPQLAAQKIRLMQPHALSYTQKFWLARHFARNIMPALTPATVDASHPFPFLKGGSVSAIYWLEDKKTRAQRPAIVTFPKKALPRFVRVPAETGGTLFVALEDVLAFCSATLFPGCRILAKGLVQVLRDGNLALDGDGELIERCEKAIKARKLSTVMCVTMSAGLPQALKDLLAENLKPRGSCLFEIDGMIGLSSLREVAGTERADLKFPAFTPAYPREFSERHGNIFAAIAAKDIMLHHPYDSFDAVIDFLRRAATDPMVVSIKQTLYRTSRDSPIIRELINAAKSGKDVTAVVELRARLDEDANIRFAQEMKKAGIRVVYGVAHMKTHAKMLLVTRQAANGELESFLHMGTGNYHPVTASVYTDISYFTADEALCADAGRIFNYLTSGAGPGELEKLWVSPHDMRKEFIALIDAEIAHARAGRPASIWVKVNALLDNDIIDALYRASRAGVKIDLIVRGICALKPGVPGLSENIRVRSIVGRFLEHSRVFCFGNGHAMPSADARVFISSADWMTRNLDRRVEYMLEITDKAAHSRIIGQIMNSNLLDNTQAWEMDGSGEYRRIRPEGMLRFSAQSYMLGRAAMPGRESDGASSAARRTDPPPARVAGRLSAGGNVIRLFDLIRF